MIKIMTGFSKSEAKAEGIKVTTEIKSLNGKGLELNFRMPKLIQHKEMEMREIFRNNISRGTVSININIETEEAEKPKFIINQEIATQCLNELNILKKNLKIKDTITLEHILRFSDKISYHETEFQEEVVLKLLSKTLQSGLKNLDNMKLKEGQNISKDIVKRMKNIQDWITKIEEISNNRIPQERERLRNKIAQLFESDEIDEHRLQMEIVLIADKIDISEETIRLASHFKFFNEAVQSKELAGRKINFLLQEIHREINTIGSKSNDALIAQHVVNAKEELERIREQIQNVE
ncbi:hypothetical protein SDC9_136154 [bioreactor metagenome]|uniref:YicC family protein n=1 Tax=bioreactor metagenome TaxID=1076179 RepID=A0A645DIA7_9ZZZZ